MGAVGKAWDAGSDWWEEKKYGKAAPKREEYIDKGLASIEEGKLGWGEAKRRQLEDQARSAALRVTPAEELRRQGLAGGGGMVQGATTKTIQEAAGAAGEVSAGVSPQLAMLEEQVASQEKARIEEMLMAPTFWEQKRLAEGPGFWEKLGGAAGDAAISKVSDLIGGGET